MILYGDNYTYHINATRNINIVSILIHTEEKPYDKSVHTGEESYIYDFIIVSLINKPGSQE